MHLRHLSWCLALACCLLARGAELVGPASKQFQIERLPALNAAVEKAIAEKQCPGGVLWVERDGEAHVAALGNRAVEPRVEAMTRDTIFDAASLTKVIATTPAIAQLMEAGQLELDAPVKRYLPRFSGAGRDAVTLRHLLTHTSGLKPGLGARGEWSGTERALEFIFAESPENLVGTTFKYSDLNFILLGEVVRAVSGERLDAYCRRAIFQPLGMLDTGFLPAPALLPRIAPTERQSDGQALRGIVHDPTARRMGGVAGHAGLFTTADDLARFARMLLNDGELEGHRVLKPGTVRTMTSVQSPPKLQVRRGLGWDIDSPYSGPRGDVFPVGSYGHTGWTGTSLWVDPYSKTFVVFLSNRNHPTEDGTVIALRKKLGTLAAQAVRGFDFGRAPAAAAAITNAPPRTSGGNVGRVRNGIDVLARDGFRPLKGKRVGLITNHTGIDRERRPTIDLLHEAPGVTLVALFSPEHGIRGQLDEKVPDGRDEKTGLPVYSLYGVHRAPQPGQLAGIDVLVYDLQDIGCRFYTYISTMGESMAAAAAAKIPFMVLDRVNPIRGTVVEGPVLSGERSFVGWHDIPVRHGMTVGELARMVNQERGFQADLTVIPCEGWSRGDWFDATDLPWINTSPNMRSLTEAVLYPGVGLIEMCHVSVGRGTDMPFERVGAPYVDDRRLAAALNGAGLVGVRFVPIRFTPTANKYAGQDCGGVQILLTDRETFRALDLGMALASTLHGLYPSEFGIDAMSRLLLHGPTLEGLTAGRNLASIRSGWREDLDRFAERRSRYLLY